AASRCGAGAQRSRRPDLRRRSEVRRSGSPETAAARCLLHPGKPRRAESHSPFARRPRARFFRSPRAPTRASIFRANLLLVVPAGPDGLRASAAPAASTAWSSVVGRLDGGSRSWGTRVYASKEHKTIFLCFLCLFEADLKYTSKCIFRHMRLHPTISYLDAAHNGTKRPKERKCRNARLYSYNNHLRNRRDAAVCRRWLNRAGAGTTRHSAGS